MIARYTKASEIVWCQEEPQNQGAWYQIRHRLQEPLAHSMSCFYAGRTASPRRRRALQLHVDQQQALVDAALRHRAPERSSATASMRAASTAGRSMSIEVKVPQLPESIADATLVAWHKKPGEAVAARRESGRTRDRQGRARDAAPVDGCSSQIDRADGATVTSGQLLRCSTSRRQRGAAATAAPKAEAQLRQAAEAATRRQPPAAAPRNDRRAGEAPPAGATRWSREQARPRRRSPARGSDGRITKDDVLHLPTHQARRAASARRRSRRPRQRRAAAGAGRDRAARADDAAARAHRRAAGQAQPTAAMLTTFNEVDMHGGHGAARALQGHVREEHGVKLGFMSFFVKACVEALRRFPVVNASVDGNDIVYHDYYDIGVAVSTERGLSCPVLRDADRWLSRQIEKAIARLARERASGKLTIDDLTGGTFTITNGGIFGSLMSTPILNPPQTGILGMHKIQERPVVVDGQIVVRPMMYLALSYDHRIIDGREAVQFLVAVKEALEDPARLLLAAVMTRRVLHDRPDTTSSSSAPVQAGIPPQSARRRLGLKTACIDEWQNLDGRYACSAARA